MSEQRSWSRAGGRVQLCLLHGTRLSDVHQAVALEAIDGHERAVGLGLRDLALRGKSEVS